MIDATALFIRCRCNLAHNVSHASDSIDDIVHCFPGAFDQHRTGINACDGVFNEGFDLFCRLGAATGKITHFTRHHGKTTALFTRTRGFNRGIQREDISLEGNTVDNADNVGNFLRTIGDLMHRFHYAIHHFAAVLGGVGGTLRQLRGLAGVIGVLLHCRGELLHAGGSFFQRGCLLFSTGGKIGVARRNFTGTGIDGI
ncbi:Uncharacterised protein [Shigella sonnei]|nr:Uncharacterised protein [Shigella sonnei]CSG06905.1 Uncharacterised protein [Shigella sonnei]CSG41788.1 Uncharacterised protein [Shigella sonnei]